MRKGGREQGEGAVNIVLHDDAAAAAAAAIISLSYEMEFSSSIKNRLGNLFPRYAFLLVLDWFNVMFALRAYIWNLWFQFSFTINC